MILAEAKKSPIKDALNYLSDIKIIVYSICSQVWLAFVTWPPFWCQNYALGDNLYNHNNIAYCWLSNSANPAVSSETTYTSSKPFLYYCYNMNILYPCIQSNFIILLTSYTFTGGLSYGRKWMGIGCTTVILWTPTSSYIGLRWIIKQTTVFHITIVKQINLFD